MAQPAQINFNAPTQADLTEALALMPNTHSTAQRPFRNAAGIIRPVEVMRIVRGMFVDGRISWNGSLNSANCVLALRGIGVVESPFVPPSIHGFLTDDMNKMKNRLNSARKSFLAALERLQQERQQHLNVAAAQNAVANAVQQGYQQGVAAGQAPPLDVAAIMDWFNVADPDDVINVFAYAYGQGKFTLDQLIEHLRVPN